MDKKEVKKGTTITASIICKNETVMILDCLNSIKTVDQICILDTGSKDDTVEKIKEFEKTYKGELILNHYVWNDHFADARNKCLSYCSKDYILIIDCDETIEKGGIAKLKRRLKHYDELTLKLSVKTDIEQLWSPRLFQNNKGIHFNNAIHNVLSTNEGGQIDVKIRSKTSPAHEQDPDRTLRILAAELKKKPDNTRNQYYIAREYLKFEDLMGSIYWFEQRTKDLDMSNEQSDAYFLLARCYRKVGRSNDAVKAAAMAIMINPEFEAPYLFLAAAMAGQNRSKFMELAKLARNTNLLFKR